jgi:hypothetical protein
VLECEADVIGHAEVGKQRVILKYQANLALLRGDKVGGARDKLIADSDTASINALEPGDGSQNRGFATAAWPKQASDIAVG